MKSNSLESKMLVRLGRRYHTIGIRRSNAAAALVFEHCDHLYQPVYIGTRSILSRLAPIPGPPEIREPVQSLDYRHHVGLEDFVFASVFKGDKPVREALDLP